MPLRPSNKGVIRLGEAGECDLEGSLAEWCIRNRSFADGELGANNLVDEGEGEASNI
jgi:hypothetical protein